MGIDVEAAILAWPNFHVFLDVLKKRPTVVPGVADDASEAVATQMPIKRLQMPQ